MMNLSEQDVRAVARSRFAVKYQWWAAGFLVFLIIVTLTASILTDSESWIPIILIVGLFAAGLVWVLKVQSKWEKELIKEWKSFSAK